MMTEFFKNHRNHFIAFLVIGILMRLAAINQPLIDAHSERQCYTAACSRSLSEQSGWPISFMPNWCGDQVVHLALEFPVYNYLTIFLTHVTGNLDVSGKLLSILFWALSFFVIQGIWRKLLSERETFWANFLFVFSPLSVFFGQVFMMEMLVQFLACTMILTLLRYRESGRLLDYCLFVLVGILGMLIKPPIIAHLFLVALFVFWQRDKWHLLFRWRYWIGGILTLTIMFLWSRYLTGVNVDYGWTPDTILAYHLRTLADRINPINYLRIGGYLSVFVTSLPGMLIVFIGIFLFRRRSNSGFVWCWLFSIVVYYLVLGFGPATGHSYYSLPALPLMCLFFGAGFAHVLDFRSKGERIWKPLLIAAIAISLVGGSLYLFRQDRVIYESAIWMRDNSAPKDNVIFVPGHDRGFINFPHEAIFAYYSNRKIWLFTYKLSEKDRQHALETAEWVVVTTPPGQLSALEKLRLAWRFETPAAAPKTTWLDNSAFAPYFTGKQFVVYKRRP
ncbi:MAG: glycosyltransferase family 39 protein [Chthoniobacterales bacterium]